MKVTVEEKQGSAPKKYPWLGCAYKNTELVVLFFEEEKGVVLEDAGTDFYPGYNRDDWSMEDFKPFQGKITLENGD